MRPLLPLLTALTALAACSDYSVGPQKDLPQSGEDTGFSGDNGDPFGGDGDTDDPDTDDPNDPDTGDPDTDDPDTDPPEYGTAGVRGRVCDPSGNGWVVGATASVGVDEDGDGTDDAVVSDVTDNDGWFELTGLPPGETVVHIEKGAFSADVTVELTNETTTIISEETCLDPDSVEVAVITGQYDDIGAILDTLTVSYDEYDGVNTSAYITFLRDPAQMATYDIIFINCGVEWDWVNYEAEIGANLLAYIRDGGRVYASDWAYWFVEATDPTMVDFFGDDTALFDPFVGDPGEVSGTVLDPYMQGWLGSSSATLTFDYNKWAIPETVGSGVSVLVEGDARVEDSSTVVSGAPLAVHQKLGDGAMLFTAFHNEPQASLDVEVILQEIILAL